MKIKYRSVLFYIFLAFSSGALAQEAKDPPAERSSGKDSEGRSFAGLQLGVGLSATYDLGENDRVTEAEVVGGLVRVTNQDNVRARIMLESHYFFTPATSFLGLTKNEDNDGEVDDPKWGIGPFVAVQPGSNEIIEAIGAGVMVGFRRNNESSNSFNIGIGIAFDPNTRTLGEGIVDGQPLPPGETAVRYLEQEQLGLLILTSFTF